MVLEYLSHEWAGDPRVHGWFLMSNPFPTIACSLFYLYAVKAGVRHMRNRPAFELRSCLVVYNCLLVALSAWIFVEGGRNGWFGHYNYACAECDHEDNDKNQRMVSIVHVYYLSKFIEMLDTMFFVLRKKNDLLTKLHLVHHGLLPISCWFTVKYVPGKSLQQQKV
jgi:elongation of very long chain fatty acids protein 7